MKRNKWIFLGMIFTFCFLGIMSAQAQQRYRLAGDQEFKVSGTSTVHDWDMVSEGSQKGEAWIKVTNGKIEEVQNLYVIIPAQSLKSGRGGMDRNAYETLNAKENPEIRFELTSVDEISDNHIEAKGDLTIAGTTRSIPLEVDYLVEEGQVKFSGSTSITFSEFNMEPPRALLGSIRTGDELTISFVSTFQ